MFKPFSTLLAAVTLLAAASCGDLKKSDDKNTLGDATRDTAVVARTGQTAGDAAANAANSVENAAGNAADAVGNAANRAGNAVANAFDITKAKLANVKLPEVNLPAVSIRGNDDYQVYGVEEKVLFDTNKAELKPSAAAALDQISKSITQRYAGKDVRIMGFADARGDKSYNRELSEKRAAAVKNYLVSTGKLAGDKVTLEAFGEEAPAASNATAAGRAENRRVEVAVALK